MSAARTHRCAAIPWRWTFGLALGVVLCGSAPAHAQEVTESSLKAAYLFNFARFTEWSPDALSPTAPLTACVLNDPSVQEALVRAADGRSLSGRSVKVLPVRSDGPLRSCNLLYISGATAAQVAAIVKTLDGSPVLTISDADRFARTGGIVHLFVQNGRLHFNIDLGLARRSGLQLSSQLLALATEVYDGPEGGRP